MYPFGSYLHYQLVFLQVKTTHKQIKAAPQSIPSSLSEHIYEIVEKSSQKQFEDSMKNECSCNLTRVTHKELDQNFHPKWQ
jgi:hypothetical protein